MSADAEHWIHSLANWLSDSNPSTLPADEIREALESAQAYELESVCEVLGSWQTPETLSAERTRLLMQFIASRCVQSESPGDDLSGIAPEVLERLYTVLLEVDPHAAAHCLQILASQADEESLEKLVDCLVQAPPESWQAVGLALSPLWRADSQTLTVFFELLGDDFIHPATMSVLLDLANYAVRQGKLDQHPWSAQCERLTDLLGSVVQRLQLLESEPGKFGESVEEVQQTLSDSVALTISLCDALALIGDAQAILSLTQALVLSHRRIQTEAAGALAKLGDEAGKQHLIGLASDRVARLHAVTYAEELGIADAIATELRTPAAMAESELASWLAAPEQFGFPPQDMELVDSRTQYWPSYEAPQNCYLFRYTYELPTGRASNIGIAGPLTHAFHVDLGNLPPEDIYCAFAGWHAEHEDIFEVPVSQLNTAQRREMERLEQTLQEQGCEMETPIALTFFLGEVSLLAKVAREDQQWCAITDGMETLVLPVSNHPASLSPETVLCIFRGRKLLRTFNP